ncbi:MAG TPA: tRNA pseudouridine(13) synthase TruD [Kofleriaceae bacterium]|nr:tRNA pseudouridine(13) synthase TruD [Kofleriaceae bacterium]
MNAISRLPYLTADLPGTGGALRVELGDFRVEELPAYQPTGEGEHVFAWIEKSGVNTIAAARELARAVGVSERDVGSAGLKDRAAVALQYLSFPPPVSPAALLEARVPGVRVLSATPHPHKLRTGHLRGNRFALILRRLAVPADQAAARARAVLERLAAPPGSPNWFGEQRFGAAGDNATAGRALLDGAGDARGRRGPAPRERRLLISAYQADLFNRYLRRRIEDGTYARVLSGDLLSLRRGGLFPTTDPAADQPRLDAGELAVTGPMFGHKMRAPVDDSEAAARERAVLDEEGIAVADFRRLGKLAPGTRRPLSIALEEVAAEPCGEDAILIRLALPSGAYATSVMREVMKAEPAGAASTHEAATAVD